MRSYLILAAWSLLAGAGIPLIGVLNSEIARSVGNLFAATAVMFVMAAIVAQGLTLPLYGHPTLAQLGSAPPISYGAGLLIGFYGLSATIIIPRLFIAYILIAQLLTSAVIDQFGLFGMARRPIDITKLVGLVVIVAGIAVMEIGNLAKARPQAGKAASVDVLSHSTDVAHWHEAANPGCSQVGRCRGKPDVARTAPSQVEIDPERSRRVRSLARSRRKKPLPRRPERHRF